MTYYKYKTKSKRTPRLNVNRVQPISNPADPTPLTGWLRGVEASDLEERFGRALRQTGKDYKFQVDIKVPGDEFAKNIDFIVDDGLFYPVEVYGEIGHNDSAQRAKDQIREALLNEYFARIGVQNLRFVWWYELDTQEAADGKVREMFL